MDATDMEGLTQDRQYHRGRAEDEKNRMWMYELAMMRETEPTLKSLWLDELNRATQRYEMHCEKAGME